jgi:hypothetical protein
LVTESPPTSINLERAAHKKLHTLANIYQIPFFSFYFQSKFRSYRRGLEDIGLCIQR